MATTSADGRTVTSMRDADGNGTIDQTQTNVTAIDGSQAETITDLGRDGVVIDKATVTISADGLTRTTQWDFDGNGTILPGLVFMPFATSSPFFIPPLQKGREKWHFQTLT